jgi:galactonate dehydratase
VRLNLGLHQTLNVIAEVTVAMRITSIETYTVGAVWKNWLFVRVNTDEGVHGVGEGTMNGFIKTAEACVHEFEHLIVGMDPRDVNAVLKVLLETVQDGGHVHHLAICAIEVACWDIAGKVHGVPVYKLLGGRVRNSILGYANGWYRAERSPTAFVEAARSVASLGFKAIKLDPFGTAYGFITKRDLDIAFAIVRELRSSFQEMQILIDVHARFAPAEAVRIAEEFAPLDIYWWEEPTTRERTECTLEASAKSPIRIATGESFDSVAKFLTLGSRGLVSIWQPEPMSLGGIIQTLKVAHLAEAHGCWIAPHQSGGPIATAVCLQLAACVQNFLIQEHFDPFNAPWTRDLVTWHPNIDPTNGHLSLPESPGLGIDLNLDAVRAHPYDKHSYFDLTKEGWERRLGRQ